MPRNKNTKKKIKYNYVDDGHTIYNMNVDGMPGYVEKPKKDNVYLTRKEKNAAIRAALLHFMPIVFLVIFCFFLTFLIINLWLS